MCEFNRKMEESRKGFGYFPKEWKSPFYVKEEFIDFARHSLDGVGLEKINSEYGIDKDSYTGFIRNYSKIDNNFDKFYSYFKEGVLRYSQSELNSGKIKVIKTSFLSEPFEIMRTYFGSPGLGNLSKPVLGVVKRIGTFNLSEDFSIKIFQHGLDSFDIYFLKVGSFKLGFSINEGDIRDRKYLSLIKNFPLIFYDSEGIKEYFGDILIKERGGKKIKIEDFLIENGI